jgi:hypothetical protein
MPSLSARLALPLIVVFLMGAVATARAAFDMCKAYCDTSILGYGHNAACMGMASYLSGLSCWALKGNDAQAQEPCISLLKQFRLICPAKDERQQKTGNACSAQWKQACYDAGGIAVATKSPATAKPESAPPPNIPQIPPGTAKLDICTHSCLGPPKSMAEICFSLAFYVGGAPPDGAGCGDPAKDKQEPCATLLKQLSFICNEKNFNAKPNGFCSKPWEQACHAGGWPPAKVSIPGGSQFPATPAKTIQACPPNMTPNANRTACVPKLDTLGGDSTPGSMPGAGRAMPGGGGTTPGGGGTTPPRR